MYANESDAPFTLERLKDHYRHCIRLSASNKINAKNAFVLQLIDYMHDLVKQGEDDGQMNFKIASSALDVGAKIYSHRVDCVHSEAQKVASSILMALDGQGNSKNHDSNVNDSQLNDSNCDTGLNNSDEGEDADLRPKKKRNVRNKNIKTVVDDEATLNGKIEKIVIGDAYLDGLSQDYDMSSPAALICYNALTQPNCVLTIESNYFRKTYKEKERPITELPTIQETQEEDSLQPTVSLISKSHNCAQILQANKTNKICSRLDDFFFNDRTTTVAGFNQNLDDSKTYLPSPKDVKRNSVGEHGFDPEMYDMPNNDDFDYHMDSGDNLGQNRDDGDLLPNLDKIAASKPKEYGYINEPRLLNTWAGPYAWKGVKAPATAKKEAPKSTRKRKLEQKPIDFGEEINTLLEEMGDKELRHSAEAIRKWKKPMLPQDHNMTDETVRQTVVRTFLRPEDTYNCPKTPAEALREVNNDHSYSARDDANSTPDMNFDNVHEDSDDEFRADPMVNGNEIALYGAQINNTLTQNADMEFAGENLIEQPFPVTQIHIPFAKVAKKMDVRKLKRVMWDMLSQIEKSMDITAKDNEMDVTVIPADEEDKDKTTSPTPSESAVHLEFSNLYQGLPSRVSHKMSHDLSQPIAFVTLLHLANEKNLRLIPKSDLKDFVIEQEEDAQE